MLLSKLVYFCIKNAVFYDDSAFTYEAFLQGKYDSDPDYATNIHNIYSPLNMAISRLNDLDRLPFAINSVTSDSNSFSVASFKDNIKEIMGVAAFYQGSIRPLNYVYANNLDTIRVISDLYPEEEVKVEYKRNIPYFVNYKDAILNGDWITGEVFFHYEKHQNLTTGNDVWEKTADPDMADYGVNDGMANYIIEYVKGCLLEPIDAHLAVMHLNRAESYFNNLPVQEGAFRQRNTEAIYRIGE